jgi:hypothetical protein
VIHVAGPNLGLLMRLLIGAGTPKEAVACGWCVLILLPTSNGAYEALIMVLPAYSAMPNHPEERHGPSPGLNKHLVNGLLGQPKFSFHFCRSSSSRCDRGDKGDTKGEHS